MKNRDGISAFFAALANFSIVIGIIIVIITFIRTWSLLEALNMIFNIFIFFAVGSAIFAAYVVTSELAGWLSGTREERPPPRKSYRTRKSTDDSPRNLDRGR